MAKNQKGKPEVKEVSTPIISKRELVLEGDPEQQLEFAHKAAKALMGWVKQKPKKVMIRGEQYLEFGDWQILARFYGATVGVEWAKVLADGSNNVRGYEARAVVYRNGEIISAAEASCLKSEKNWKDRDEFMLKSMAQTRASAKALRQAFGWVAELAGMKSTPAEELGEVYDQSIIKDDAPVIVAGADAVEIPEDIMGQRQMLLQLLKDAGVDVTSSKACKTYVADKTQLELVEGNFVKIITLLSK